MQTVNYAAKTHTGQVREHNEDSICVNSDLGLYVVADGMGGHASGEVASAIAVDSIEQLVMRGVGLVEAIEQAHQDIIESAATGAGRTGMGTTVVAVQVSSDAYTLAWVGDSRAYLWSDVGTSDRLMPLSKDHSLVQMLMDSGQISVAEAKRHPRRNIIYQNLGAQDTEHLQVSVKTGQLFKGQFMLLCSDGLTDELEDEQIAEIMASAVTPENMVDRLIEAALGRGGHDNISAIVFSASECAAEMPVEEIERSIDKDTLVPEE